MPILSQGKSDENSPIPVRLISFFRQIKGTQGVTVYRIEFLGKFNRWENFAEWEDKKEEATKNYNFIIGVDENITY